MGGGGGNLIYFGKQLKNNIALQFKNHINLDLFYFPDFSYIFLYNMLLINSMYKIYIH